MKQIKAALKKVDLFGVPVTALTDKAKDTFDSIIGGIISIVVTVLSVCYFGYMIDQWKSGYILPSISLNQEAIQYQKFTWQTPLIQIKSIDPTSTIDPFSKTNNIITPLLFTLVNENSFEIPQVLFSDPNLPSTVVIEDGSLILNSNFSDDVPKAEQSHIYFLSFAKCNDQLMNAHSYCASEETINEYVNSFHGFISINVNIQQFDSERNEFKTITKTILQALSPEQYQFSSINLKIQDTIVDDGWLFAEKKYSTSINNFEIINQVIGPNYLSSIISWYTGTQAQFESVMTFSIALDNIKMVNQITMAKLNSVLAQIGSIVQLIFMLRYIAIYINQTLLYQKMAHQVMSMYYRNLSNYTIKHDCLLRPVGAINRDQNNRIGIERYRRLQEFAQQKLRLTNIIYEISRIQFILQRDMGVTDFHQLGDEFLFHEIQVRNRNSVASSSEEGGSQNENYDAIKFLTQQQRA